MSNIDLLFRAACLQHRLGKVESCMDSRGSVFLDVEMVLLASSVEGVRRESGLAWRLMHAPRAIPSRSVVAIFAEHAL